MTLDGMSTRRLVAALFILTFLSPVTPPARVRAEPLATTRFRIGVTQDGLTVVSPQDLADAGVDPAGVDPRTFALSSLGSAVAIRVTGESDGRFDSNDRLLFFGERYRDADEMNQKYTDERVYWLDIGGAAGPRIPDVSAAPQGNLTPPANFAESVRAEESLYWWTLHTLTIDTQDSWFWARLQPVASTGAAAVAEAEPIFPRPIDTAQFPSAPLVDTANLPLFAPDPVQGAPATLRLEEIARASSPRYNPDHRTTIVLNDDLSLLNEEWDGKVRRVFQVTVPPGALLADGANTIRVGAQVPSGPIVDDVYVNYIELDYRRLFRASAGQLDFVAESAGPHEYLVSGWSTSPVEIWDVTDPASPRRMTNATTSSSGGDVSVRFRVNDAPGARFWLQASEPFRSPASLQVRPPTGLRAPAGGADVVIVTDESLLAPAQSLAAWHASQGRRPLVTQFRDVVDEFNDGIYHPKAVPAMLAWAGDHWEGSPPIYLTLFGDGHWNFKGFNPALYPSRPNPIPPYLAWIDPWQGEVPADALYGDLDGDLVPDLAVGRVPANTVAEGQIMVDKIIAYDESARVESWQKRSLFVADDYDPFSGDFQGLSDNIIRDYLPADQQAQRVYLFTPTAPNAAAARSAIASALQAGVFMVQYMGHGAIDSWALEQMWRTMDVGSLQNGNRLPIVMTFNCLDGYFAYPGQEAMAEQWMRQPGGGAVAAISPSGLGITPDEQNLRELLMAVMFEDEVQQTGRALLLAKLQFYSTYGQNYLLQSMMLYGDPAMRLPLEAKKTFLPLVLRSN